MKTDNDGTFLPADDAEAQLLQYAIQAFITDQEPDKEVIVGVSRDRTYNTTSGWFSVALLDRNDDGSAAVKTDGDELHHSQKYMARARRADNGTLDIEYMDIADMLVME